jgi:hypothetical protein
VEGYLVGQPPVRYGSGLREREEEGREGEEATWPSPPHSATTFSWPPFLRASSLLLSSLP